LLTILNIIKWYVKTPLHTWKLTDTQFTGCKVESKNKLAVNSIILTDLKGHAVLPTNKMQLLNKLRHVAIITAGRSYTKYTQTCKLDIYICDLFFRFVMEFSCNLFIRLMIAIKIVVTHWQFSFQCTFSWFSIFLQQTNNYKNIKH